MRTADLGEEMWALLFDVRRSIRYHDRRRHFFLTAHRFTAAAGAIFGSAALAAFLGKLDPPIGMAAAALVTVASVLDLVVGFSAAATLHHDLKRRFIELEQEIIKRHDETALAGHQLQRLTIERDEPAVRRALDRMCYNDIVRAEYPRDEASEKYLPLTRWQQLSAHLFEHANMRP